MPWPSAVRKAHRRGNYPMTILHLSIYSLSSSCFVPSLLIVYFSHRYSFPTCEARSEIFTDCHVSMHLKSDVLQILRLHTNMYIATSYQLLSLLSPAIKALAYWLWKEWGRNLFISLFWLLYYPTILLNTTNNTITTATAVSHEICFIIETFAIIK